MKAVLLTAFGGTDKLKLSELPEPEVGPCEVLVRVKAVALNHLDLWVRKGALPVKPELPHVLGSDVAGVVVKTGPGVKKFKEGDEVVVMPGLSCGLCEHCQSGDDNLCPEYDILGLRSRGGYAELVKVPERNLLKKPKNLSFEEAASYPLTFLTAWNALVDKIRIKPGERVLIWAGGSGVGVAAVQIAKLFNAFVITTVGSSEKAQKCRQLGADVVINHYEEDALTRVKELFPEGIDAVVDHVGSKTLPTGLKLLKKGGRLAFFGTTTGSEVGVNLRELFTREIKLYGVYMGRRGSLFKITRLFEEGKLRPVIDRVFRLEEAARAHEYLESSKHFGKVVLKVD
ncbi:MAG: zinc-binding dehydrogenase [Aquificae bacterium]|nr:zinc-binding dehydrogenase [Aquificota bacterium]